jgi:hypothetical protein
MGGGLRITMYFSSTKTVKAITYTYARLVRIFNTLTKSKSVHSTVRLLPKNMEKAE